MVSTKPPCAITIDGVPTHLTTPQRHLTLPAGSHQITLVNAARRVNKTVDVDVVGGRSTKLIRDFM
jgi:hypothetical protein